MICGKQCWVSMYLFPRYTRKSRVITTLENCPCVFSLTGLKEFFFNAVWYFNVYVVYSFSSCNLCAVLVS